MSTSRWSLASRLAPNSLKKGSKNWASNFGPVGLFKRVTTSNSCGGICCNASAAARPLPFSFSAFSHAFTAVPTRARSRCAWTLVQSLYQLSASRQAGQRSRVAASPKPGSKLGSASCSERDRKVFHASANTSAVSSSKGCAGSSSGRMSASACKYWTFSCFSLRSKSAEGLSSRWIFARPTTRCFATYFTKPSVCSVASIKSSRFSRAAIECRRYLSGRPPPIGWVGTSTKGARTKRAPLIRRSS
mmetsp:Transcript_44462/g.70687  ORF Transcript_44462/g.70687 Transcript_44462/m.70687 type:complete len:246 (+) Transcript_44462:130-867(+)